MNYYNVLQSILALTGVWGFVYYLWRDYRIDAFRDHLFSIRDRMFLYAANGNISFENPAYSTLRNRMNILLRYGHEFTLTRMVLVAATYPILKGEALVKWEAAVQELPTEIQRKMREFNTCIAVSVLQHILYYSFFRYLVLRPLMVFVNPFQVREIVELPKVVSRVEQLETDALEHHARLFPRRPVAA